MSPPLEAAPAPYGFESSDWPGPDHEEFDVREGIMKLFPITHNDPTGQKALRAIQKQIGYFEPEAELHLVIKSKRRGNIDIRIDYELKSMVAELVNRAGTVTPTKSGERYRARIKKNTPAAVEFGDMNSSRGLTENTTI